MSGSSLLRLIPQSFFRSNDSGRVLRITVTIRRKCTKLVRGVREAQLRLDIPPKWGIFMKGEENDECETFKIARALYDRVASGSELDEVDILRIATIITKVIFREIYKPLEVPSLAHWGGQRILSITNTSMLVSALMASFEESHLRLGLLSGVCMR